MFGPKLNNIPAECGIIAALGSPIMDGLLVRGIGAPNNSLIATIAILLGLSLGAIVGLLLPSKAR